MTNYNVDVPKLVLTAILSAILTAVAVVGMRCTPIAREADLVVRLPLEVASGERRQPMGSLFEQALLLYLDGIVLRLMEQLGMTAEEMERVHSNLPLPSTGANS